MSIREFIETHEGGLSEDPRDPGGTTNHGISFRFLRGLHPDIADIDGDGDVDEDDIRALNKDQAWALFVDVIFIPSGIYLLQGKLSEVCMDCAVNMGAGRAVRVLQRAINKSGGKCAVDGVIGPETTLQAQLLPRQYLISEVLHERISEYKKIVERNSKLAWAYAGWVNRVVELRAFVAKE